MNLTAVERFELHCPKTLLSTLQAPNIHNRGNNLLLLQMTTRDGTDCDTGKLKPYTSIPLKLQQPNTECRRSLFVCFSRSGNAGRSFFRAVSQWEGGVTCAGSVSRGWRRPSTVFCDTAKLPGRVFTGTAWHGKMALPTWTATMAAE